MGPDHVGQILNFPASPRMSEDHPHPGSASLDTETDVASPDELEEVDRIFETRLRSLRHSEDRRSQVDVERVRLQEEFSTLCTTTVRPAMQAFLERLRINGGGGLLEERTDVQGAGVAARIRLWISLSGELIGRPRQDQHPFLQLDLDVVEQRVTVVEGDMWKGHGTSGPVGTWVASEITHAMVTESLIAVLRRAAT
jgi:hypothetical protein